MAGALGEDVAGFGFVLRQGLVVELLPGPVQSHGVVAGCTDVQAKENTDALLLAPESSFTPPPPPRRFAETGVLAGQERQEITSTLPRTRRRASISDQPAGKPVLVATPPDHG